jgi:hypothetical protein
MTKHDFAIMTVAVAALAFCSSCVMKECTAMGCFSHFKAKFNKSTAWEDTTWQVAMRADGSDVGTCEIELPGSWEAVVDACPRDLQLRLNESEEAIESVKVRFQSDAEVPSEFTVRVKRDGNLVAEQAFEPTYETYWPNGPSCGTSCQQAEAEFAF